KTDIPFLGRDAVEQIKAAGPKRLLVSFVLDDPSMMMWGGELLLRNGAAGGNGQVTSAAWGTTLGRCVGLAYVWDRTGGVVTPDFINEATWQVNVGGTLVAATLSLRSPYDPGSERIRA
ncbi:MAG: FAD-dependent oxidoreductase, partial [Actinobacteria bacterium]|nr:FAD-dependent oxidoreductase [Actinomycetota bacterium]